jgi:hypothetical protein
MAIVYLHRRKDNNEVFYVGIGTSPKRAYELKHSRNIYWKNVVNKYGHIIEITHTDINWEEACCIERYLISFWKENSKIELCNFNEGGEGNKGYKFTKEQIEKVKSRYTPDVRLKHSQTLKIAMNKPDVKIKQSQSKMIAMNRPDVKNKQRLVQSKVYSNQELRNKQSVIQKIIQNTPEAKENNRKRALIQFSDVKQREKISNSLKKYYSLEENKKRLYKKTYQYSIDGIFLKEYVSTINASKETGYNEKSILRAIKNNKAYKGFLWKRN